MLQLASGLTSTVVLSRRSDPETVLAALNEHGCTSLIVVPAIAQRLLELPPAVRESVELSALRVVATSGAPLSADLSNRFQDAFGDVLYNVYGATEVSWATIAGPEDLRLSPGTAGRPPHGTRIALLDEMGVPVPKGEIGGIAVGNDLLFEGYTDGRDRHRANGMMATGDRGRIDEYGFLTVLGREDDLVISGGENVYPSVLEELLLAQPQVREVAVIGVPDAQLGQRLAYLDKRVAQMQYPRFREQGWPIGSGSGESANKLVVEERLKGPGMHWAVENVNPMLALRNAVCNDRWEESWAVIEGEQRRQMSERRQAHCRTRTAVRAAARATAAPAAALRREPRVRRRVRPLEPEMQSRHPWTFAWSVRRQCELAGSA
jgi:acyl-CoA synthetase (AMP-forming)/AMP-acid ligase II